MPYTFALPIKTDKVPAGPDWLHEMKYDRYRMMLIRVCFEVQIGKHLLGLNLTAFDP
jgi:hypothetical protein